MTGRALVAGWFSFPEMGATAGDLMACDVVSGWLGAAGLEHDIAYDRAFPGGVDWRTVDPRSYSHLVVVCGPFYARRKLLRVVPQRLVDPLVAGMSSAHELGLRAFDRFWLEALLLRFRGRRTIGVDLSMLGPPESWYRFDALLARDGAGLEARPDLSLLDDSPTVPVVGRILAEHQREYALGAHARADRLITDMLARRDVAVVPIDTRLDPPNRGGLGTPAQVASLIAKTDVVVTTRLHGTVLALKSGVPAVVVDPVAGGAKVTAQARALGWPHALTVDQATPERLAAAFEACLQPDARRLAQRCADAGAERLRRLGVQFQDAL